MQITLHTDPQRQPDALRCSCKLNYPWKWVDLGPHESRLFRGGRWVAPKVSPCPSCEEGNRARELRARIMRRTEEAGFPYVDHIIHRDRMMLQTGDNAEAFQENVRQANQRRADDGEPPMLGILSENANCVHAMRAWEPGNRSVFVHGDPGTGKTLTVSAWGRRMLSVDDTMRRVYVDRHGEVEGPAPEYGWDFARTTAMVRKKPPALRYVRLEDIIRQQRDRYAGGKRFVQDFGRFYGILFVDELGIAENPTTLEQDVVNHILGTRMDHKRPTVMISNLTPDGFRNVYGERVGSRLRECTVLHFSGPDWRG